MTDKPFSKIQPRAGFIPCAGFFLSAQRCLASVRLPLRRSEMFVLSEKQNVLPHEKPT